MKNYLIIGIAVLLFNTALEAQNLNINWPDSAIFEAHFNRSITDQSYNNMQPLQQVAVSTGFTDVMGNPNSAVAFDSEAGFGFKISGEKSKPTNQLTIAARFKIDSNWFNNLSAGQNISIVSLGSSSLNIRLGGKGAIELFLNVKNGNTADFNGNFFLIKRLSNIEIDYLKKEFCSVVLEFKAENNTTYLCAGFNGALVFDQYQANNPIQYSNSDSLIILGTNLSTSGKFQGIIDNVVIYPKFFDLNNNSGVLDAFSFGVDPNIYFEDGELFLSQNGEVGTNFEWIKDNSTIVQSGTNPNCFPTIAGVYKCKIRNQENINGVPNFNTYTTFTKPFQFVGTNSAKNIKTSIFSLSPNPTKDLVTINSKVVINFMRMVNSVGQVINTLPINGTNYSFSTKHLSAGTYYIQVTGNFGTTSQVLIKE